MKAKQESKVKVYISNILYFFLIGIIILLGINFLGKSDAFYNIFKLRSYVILSGSMEPKIMTGDLVFVRKVDGEDLEVGDVATFNYEHEYTVTHRIIEKDTENEEFVTKGDNNDKPDNKKVGYENIIGKVMFKVPYMGHVVSFLANPICLMVIMGLLGGYVLWNTFKD